MSRHDSTRKSDFFFDDICLFPHAATNALGKPGRPDGKRLISHNGQSVGSCIRPQSLDPARPSVHTTPPLDTRTARIVTETYIRVIVQRGQVAYMQPGNRKRDSSLVPQRPLLLLPCNILRPTRSPDQSVYPPRYSPHLLNYFPDQHLPSGWHARDGFTRLKLDNERFGCFLT